MNIGSCNTVVADSAGEDGAADAAGWADDDTNANGASDVAGAVDGTPTADPLPAQPPTWKGDWQQIQDKLPGGLKLELGQGQKPLDQNGYYPNHSGGLLVDANDDGRVDIVTFSQAAKVRVLLQQPNGSWQQTAPAYEPEQKERLYAVTLIDRGQGSELLLGDRPVRSFRWVEKQWLETTASLGIKVSDEGGGLGLHVADLDNDGRLDVLVGVLACDNGAHTHAFFDRGDGTMEERTVALKLQFDGSPWGHLATDLDGDGDLDIAYLHDGCGEADNGMPNTTQAFLRNLGRGEDGWPRWQREIPNDLFAFPTALVPFASPMAAVTTDFDRDGLLDVFVANVGLPISIKEAMKFLSTEDPTLPRIAQNNLLIGQKNGTLLDSGLAAGLKSLTEPVKKFDLSTWGVAPIDFDRDGWPDLALATAPESQSYFTGDRGPMRALLLRNQGGVFTEVLGQNAWPVPFPSKTMSAGDLDGDGDEDLLIGGFGTSPLLLQNNIVHGNNWLRVVLRGTTSNSMAIGAHVSAEFPGAKLVREVGPSATYAAAHQIAADFGLGLNATVPILRIHWPSGYEQVLHDVASNQTLKLTEPALLSVDKRVVKAGEVIQVTAQIYDSAAQPQQGVATVEIVPKGATSWQKPLVCDEKGLCTGSLKVLNPPATAPAIWLHATLNGLSLATWPRLTVLK